MTSHAPQILWTPSADMIERATLTRYIRWLREERELQFANYGALWNWSVERIDEFWESIWDFFEVQGERGDDRVLGRREMPGAEWFPGTMLNWAEHVLRAGDDDGVAIISVSELRPEVRETTWRELAALTARVAAGLRRLGVGPGDRVAAYMPNTPEAIAALLACASIGAVWSRVWASDAWRFRVSPCGRRGPRAWGERERGVGWDVWSDFEDDLSVWLERDVARWFVPVLSADVDSYACVVRRWEWPEATGRQGLSP